MTSQTSNLQNQPAIAETQKLSDKEINFRAFQAKFEREIEQEKRARLEAEKKVQELLLRTEHNSQDNEENDEPYVNREKLNKTLSSFEKKFEEKFEKMAENKAKALFEGEKQQNWIKNNPDFYDTLTNHANKLMEKAPQLAEALLKMPDNFDRQILVYNNIKALNLDKPEQKESSIQDKIDANRRTPYYQPSGIANSPSNFAGDFSPTGQKKAYEHLQALKSRLKL